MNHKDYNDASKDPPRQGFYEVETELDQTMVAEWREHTPKQGKRWWQYLSDDPTVAKTPQPLDGVKRWRVVDKKKVDELLKRKLTLAERLDRAYESHRSLRDLEDMPKDLPPPYRQLKPGDAIEYGALLDCRVVELRDEGRAVLFQYHDRKKVYGQDVDNGIAYMCGHWTEAIKLETIQPTKLTRESTLYGSYSNSDVYSLFSRWMRGLDDCPDYQRGYAWTEADQQRYLESLFEGRELGRFIFVERPFPHREQVLDGKQRLNCLSQFFTSRITYKGKYWHELSARDRATIERRSVQWASLPEARLTRAALLRIFLEVNAAGVPQSEEHLAYVKDLLAKEEALEAQQVQPAPGAG